MRKVQTGEITDHVERYLRVRSSAVASSRRRERSWDFCFNHFADHERPTEVMELSCLHLGYYLASWGMLRGSSFLFRETNLRHYQDVIEVIQQHNPTMRGLDVESYRHTRGVEATNSAWKDLRAALLPAGGRSITLVSKVMMGVWGCLPSYDTFFLQTFRALSESREERGAFVRASNHSMVMLADFYAEHANEIDALRHLHHTLDFTSGTPTNRLITRAKIIDIFGFQQAYSRSND